jgi:hypothetical protein
MATLRGIAHCSDCPLTHTLLAYWRKFYGEIRMHSLITTGGNHQFAETVVSEFLLIGKRCSHRMTSN